MANDWDEVLVAQEVTYTLEVNGKLFVIENVPARINLETDKQFFSRHGRTLAADYIELRRTCSRNRNTCL